MKEDIKEAIRNLLEAQSILDQAARDAFGDERETLTDAGDSIDFVVQMLEEL